MRFDIGNIMEGYFEIIKESLEALLLGQKFNSNPICEAILMDLSKFTDNLENITAGYNFASDNINHI